ncbi:MAG: type II toxin-antitoxin system MqsA family antitoxin [Candidatus Marinimicrobia bacterium]|nr:type II toxin-antitoxin system MqsA family antitoxin [Candidatus Neomarinimicrobiota bacterium]MCF7829245.1 type II toxin-antitoxin system MqsA family antitoxin [Candidatus Neomarinimicrobiota bacterium]MCF7881102.1 type II toxin-antitoxin system MqsA family antitoxin [Candidatus Neomarinimicrobiota bacterium]
MFHKEGDTEWGKTTVTLERKGTVIVLRNVPAQICDNCGEFYLDDETTEQVLNHAERAIGHGTEVEVAQFVE